MSNNDLTDLQLNVLIVVYYAKVGVALNEPSQVDWGDSCKFLVDAGLIRYTGMMRDTITIRSWSSPMIVEKLPGPITYTAAAITEKGKKLVEDIGTARKVEACIAMESSDTARALADSLSAEELPLLLASNCEFVRDAAKDRLTALGNGIRVEEDSGGKMYLIDLQGGHVVCIKGLSD